MAVPATSYDLVTIADVKALLGITATATGNDAALALWISQASKQAQNFCNQPFVVETIRDQIWPPRDGVPWTVRPDLATLQLSRWPIVTVSSVVETISGVPTTLVENADFMSDPENGRLYRLDASGNPKRWTANPVVVVYQAGWPAIPDDVVSAVVELVKMKWFAQGRDPMIREENVEGVVQTSYWFGSGPASTSGIPAGIADQLDNYRVPVIA